MDPRLIEKLREREAAGTLRNLRVLPDNATDFCSNDYLGLAQLTIEMRPSGGTGSRLISGTTQLILEAEQTVASYFNAEAALMFNSGYDANLGFFSAVPQRGDTILYDALIHASIRDGMRLSFAHARAFPHNDLCELERQLEKAKGQIYVVVESLYSMDGDFAPLDEILGLCERYEAWLVVDEAHAFGIYGEGGKGLCATLNSPQLLARLLTFGKAFGSHGACWLGSEELIRYLCNFARSFIYTTALPEGVYVHNAALVGRVDLEERREKLRHNIHLFRNLATSLSLRSEDESPIQIVETGAVETARRMATACQESGMNVKAIYPPTVPVGKECVRVCIHCFNTQEEIERLVQTLEDARHTI